MELIVSENLFPVQEFQKAMDEEENACITISFHNTGTTGRKFQKIL